MDLTLTTKYVPIKSDRKTRLFSLSKGKEEKVFHCEHKGAGRETTIPSLNVFFETKDGKRHKFVHRLPVLRSCCTNDDEVFEAWHRKIKEECYKFMKNELREKIVAAENEECERRLHRQYEIWRDANPAFRKTAAALMRFAEMRKIAQ